jgi:glycerol-3-phosphate acyltransferase PlsY
VGSGNVGGRNALDVTGKKSVGVIVVFIDVLKGIVSVALASVLFEEKDSAISFTMVGAVTGHCYPVWLKFKGGRGLATVAGAFLATSWFWVPVWLGLYFASSKIIKNIHISSVVALAVTPVAAWLIPEQWIVHLITGIFSREPFLMAGTMAITICLTKHIQPLKEIYAKKNN